jgi:hypothetical protein
VAENLGDLGQRDPGIRHLAGERVAETVRSHNRHARSHTRTTHDARDPIRPEWPDGRNSSQVHLALHASLWAAPAQVGGHRLADIVRQREAALVASLSADRDLAGPPVDVLQAEVGNLAGPQAESEQGEQDCVVPPSLCSPSVARSKEASGSLLIDPHRQRRAAPPGDRKDRRRQVVWRQPFDKAEAQE